MIEDSFSEGGGRPRPRQQTQGRSAHEGIKIRKKEKGKVKQGGRKYNA